MHFLETALEERRQAGILRQLFIPDGLIDFASNDYLGFAKKLKTTAEVGRQGATGSRLISGNSHEAEALEQKLAYFHEAESGLLFNSGYDANVGLLSCLAQAGDTYLSDAFIHASMIDGMRLSKATRLPFKHNDLQDLEAKLIALASIENKAGKVFICIESVYSMDGDVAPLRAIAELASQYHAYLIVDEAHATGTIGTVGEGLVQTLGLQDTVLARIHTFGKAIGAHGAVVLGSQTLRTYLINFARSFIYSTALPLHSLCAISEGYDLLKTSFFQQARTKLYDNIQLYKQLSASLACLTLPSDTAIQAVIAGNNDTAKQWQASLQQAGIYAKAIVSPTIPKGTERLRVCLHSFNTATDIHTLFEVLKAL